MLERPISRLEPSAPADDDPSETGEWLDALDSVFRYAGGERAAFLLSSLARRAGELGVALNDAPVSPYQNTIPPEKQAPFPGDLALEERITAIMRWNALAMVMRANLAAGELGGHIASYASAAEIFEVGFNHFFRAGGDGRRRHRLFPAALGARRLRARLSRRAAVGREPEALPARDRRRRPQLLSSSVADAGLLADADRIDGDRADQRDLSGALHALPREPRACRTRAGAASGACSATARWTSRSRSPGSRSRPARGSTI